ncbi:NAD-dependent epimerase/dehydratase family protein [Mycolicibacterium tokaiense]|uniref:Uncharacterized conserved protein n=1 Tax=Mycolicibacterium tokaiense TaxID=39695 RepID=A0A378TE37_9MYCO|nr:NAD(P)-dependent oxidoreductase [Mycolicibacterium tokaiense]BBY86483.1 hypothetical protein MTOK_22650 [Mycolicibacterium tokaiense]STZ59009.1 Uncharacterized conserved protein [Mycolicibacterium tokaiense]
MCETTNPTVAVTGASGYVGGAVCSAFAAAGYRVIALQRSVPRDGHVHDHIPYSLEGGLERALPDGVAAVIHCAYDLRERDPELITRVNVGGTARLLAAAGTTPMVLMSSMSAHAGTSQIYGQAKLACERLVTDCGGTALRLGLVYDDAASGGMVGALRKVSSAPIVPMPHPEPSQYTVHVHDMTRCVLSVVQQAPPQRILGVAHPRPVPLSEIVSHLRAMTKDTPLRSVRVPTAMIHRLLRAIEAVGLWIGFRADSVVGLANPAPVVPHVGYWQDLGIMLRDFGSGRAAQSMITADCDVSGSS